MDNMHQSMAKVLRDQGSVDEAMELHCRSLDNQMKTFERGHPFVGETYIRMGMVRKKKENLQMQ